MAYFHDIDPIAFSIPAFTICWYMALIAGLFAALFAWRAVRPHGEETQEERNARTSTLFFSGAVAFGLLGQSAFMFFRSREYPVGPIGVHWYGIMYLASFLFAWYVGNRRIAQGRLPTTHEGFSDLSFYVMMGVILGGRIGYMLFYVPLDWMLREPLALFRVWEGGMSFHGGLLGVLVAGWWWSRRNKIHFFDTVDFVAPLVPIGLGLGRLGNFIGGELWGRHTDVAWGVIFPRALDALGKTRDELREMYLAGQLNHEARHPSQLYEFTLEGLVMFGLLMFYSRKPRPRYAVSGLFALLYGSFRFGVEFVREPDVQLGFLAFDWLTMGQVLSVPLIITGLVLLRLSRRAPTITPPAASAAAQPPRLKEAA